MKIAVTYDNGSIFQHFGYTETFKMYEVEDNNIINSYLLNTGGTGHGALGLFLKKNNVSVVICGGIGGGAQTILKSNGIKLYGGCSGLCDEAVEALLKNELKYNPKVMCNHEHHEHSCGEHSCTPFLVCLLQTC